MNTDASNVEDINISWLKPFLHKPFLVHAGEEYVGVVLPFVYGLQRRFVMTRLASDSKWMVAEVSGARTRSEKWPRAGTQHPSQLGRSSA